MSNIIKECPCCKGKLVVSKLECTNCDTTITGKFKTSAFDALNEEQLNFALCFIYKEGNIKAIEKELGISYPTVKKYLDEVKSALGFKEIYNSRDVILNKVKSGELSLKEAREMLKDE